MSFLASAFSRLSAGISDVRRAFARKAAEPPVPATAIEDVLDAAILRLDQDGNVIDAAGKAEALFGVAVNFLLDDGLFQRVQVADRVTYLRALSQVRGGASQYFDVRIRVAGDGGAPTYLPFHAELHHGTPDLLILRPNQAVEALQAEVARLREELAKTDVAKAAFLATVSHELRTPLNAIIGFSDMLAFEMVGRFTDPRQRDYATLIRESGSHLLAVVNSILDISRIESRAYAIHPEPFAFAEAAAACHAMLAAQAQAKSVELRNGVTPSIGEVNADRRAVQQILINLLGNAVKFTPNGGTVSLEARRNARSIIFEVHDNGIGMSAEDLARVGRPFVQANGDYAREHDGVGLGLSIAKGLVALHGGALSISSAPGAGTMVSVTLPLEGAATRATEQQNTMLQEEHGDVPFRKSA